ncbi:MAG TPA: AAA family ATPase [Candidatus Saccharimonadales bacterium]|nr:AAA family ATPase [Candidatus Saccharimonadales bacterium]
MNPKQGDVWVVAGPVGAGKTTVANILLSKLNPIPALLDKDTIYGPFVSATLAAAGRPEGEREGEWYDKNIKIHEYAGMTETAKEVRSYGCSVLLSGPFTGRIHDAKAWGEWVKQLGGGTVRLVWVKSDKETLWQRLNSRNSKRDAQKIAKFDEFIQSMKVDIPPPIPHITIDNRLSAEQTLEEQITEVLKQL